MRWLQRRSSLEAVEFVYLLHCFRASLNTEINEFAEKKQKNKQTFPCTQNIDKDEKEQSAAAKRAVKSPFLSNGNA